MEDKLGSFLINSWVDKQSEQRIYEFDSFRLDASHRILSRNGEDIELAPKAVETLLALVEMRGKVVSKDELLEIVWPDTIVEESNLFSYLSHLRKALGTRTDGKPYVETLRRRGYRFTADVRLVAEIEPEPLATVLRPRTVPRAARSGPMRISTNSGRVVALAEWQRDDPDREASAIEKEIHEDAILRPVPAVRSKRWFMALVGSSVLTLGVLGFYFWKVALQPANAPVKTIAVLPFKPLVPETPNEYLEFGMADTLIGKLNSSGEIIARPLTSVRKFTGEDRDVAAIGRELGVDYVLDGNIQTSDDRIRVSVRLISTGDGRELWAKPFNENFTDIFEVQDAIAQRVATELRPQLPVNARSRVIKRNTEDPEAYRLYLLGRYHVAKLILPETQKGISYLDQAIALDPNYALAYTELANAYRALALGGDQPADEVLPKSKEAALRALEIDDGLAEAHVVAGQAVMFERNWAEAENRGRRALELEPNNAAAMYLLEHVYSMRGQHDEAIEMGKKACELNPLSLIYNSVEAQTLLYAGRVDDALQRALQTRELDDNFWHVHLTLARIYAQKGMYREAIAEADRASQLSGDHSYDLAVKGYALAKSGAVREALDVVDTLEKRSGTARHYTNVALVYVGLGAREKAVSYLERGFEDQESQLEMNAAPAWSELRSEPRFLELLRKMGFE